MKKEVLLATDGACKGNPGPGGYGTILIFNQYRKEFAEGFRLTTNNRMEMLAVIKGLEALKESCKVKVLSDSKYIVDNVKGGHPWKWQARGWVLASKKPAKNSDLWEDLLNLLAKHEVEFEWVKGHSGHELNDRADELATGAAEQGTLLEDYGFEK
ncbi:ribonuclease H [Lentisphaera araneosa HTCC2155]|uniref:Ribonuclease H n=1 Tax=Lentisphaera araneosa HTCC2155 TaxID=313628 RepID=A6DH28_9BACT|nr:ribonuclease HI [Lentisphaera araneosa]EDM28911.1 ribonuclease H [Lentisphaera araneosa HTCC2155]